MQQNQDWSKRDLAVLWHPCTQMKDHEKLPLIPIKAAKGVWLEDFAGRRYLDAISSWWVNLFGHSHPVINAALKTQLDELQHVLLAGFTHQPIIELSEKLLTLLPAGLSRCFYTENGSSAIEVALKMSYHYWRNQGKTGKNKFVTLSNSYHGETLGALAVGNVALYKDTYGELLMDVITVPGPDCFYREPGESYHDYSVRQFAQMRKVLAQQHREIAAVIVEPLVQCAGNMRMYDPVYLRLLRQACDEFNVHLIADEVAVGFGRTGTLFACEQAEITPDFICLAKGLTGGYLPLAVTVTHEAIYQAFYDDYQTLKAFLHSHSYTGYALGCRAALATLSLFAQQDVLGRNRELAACMAAAAQPLHTHPHVAEVRQTGMIMAIELVQDKATRTAYPWQQRRGLRVYEYGLKNEMLLRPLGNVVYFMPPYVITEAEIQKMVAVATAGIELATAD